jgi:type II secretory pathway component PulF
MPEFVYRAKRGPTEVVNGHVEAGTLDEAMEKLDRMGLFPIHLDEMAPETKKETPPGRLEKKSAEKSEQPVETKSVKPTIFSRIKSSEITLFGRQLASLIKSGVPILRALRIIGEQTQNLRFRRFLDDAQKQINNGKTLSAVLSGYPKMFSPIYVAMVRTGEDSGNLEQAMLRISDYRQKQEEILSRVRTAMAYPALMAFTGIGTIIFMLTYVIPKLTGLFSSLGSHLPLPTRILMKISHGFQNPWFWFLTGFLLLSMILLVRLRAEQMKWLWSVLSLKIPGAKSFVMKADVARFSKTLELLIKSGLPILRAMEIATPVLNNRVLRTQLERAREDLTGGGSLGKSLRECGVFPLFMTNLISVSEESGKLDEAMQEIAQFYEHETDEAIRIMTSLMEPLMILVMGLIVGFIVISMMLPMFELNMIVK